MTRWYRFLPLPLLALGGCLLHQRAPEGAAPESGSGTTSSPAGSSPTVVTQVAVLDTSRMDLAPAGLDSETVVLLRQAEDSAADAAVLDQLDSAAASDSEDESNHPGGANDLGAVTWDIDVQTFTNHDRVQYYLAFFQGAARERFAIWLQRMPRYETMIRQRLAEQGLPGDMVYLALIESGFSNTAVSRASAVGMWQFIKGTARLYGLRVDSWVDERRDPYLATVAATPLPQGPPRSLRVALPGRGGVQRRRRQGDPRAARPG